MKKNQLKEMIAKTLKKFMTESAPPKFPVKLEKELLKRYSDDSSKAYATMWTIHKKKNEGDEKINEMWMIWEQKSKNDVMQEGLQHHLKTKTPFTNCIFRPGSTSFFKLMLEAKKLYIEGSYTPDDEYETEVLKSDIGEYGVYEGKKVPLDYPHEDDDEELTELDVKGKTNGKGLNKPFRSGGGGSVYVKTGKDSIRKINFSQSGMKKRFNEPGALKSFMARHNCLDNKDKTTAGYWACRWPRYFSDSGKQWW